MSVSKKRSETYMSERDLKVLLKAVEKFRGEFPVGPISWPKIWEDTKIRNKSPAQLSQRYYNYMKKVPKNVERATAFSYPSGSRRGHNLNQVGARNIARQSRRSQEISSDEDIDSGRASDCSESPCEIPSETRSLSTDKITAIASLLSQICPCSVADERIVSELGRIVNFPLDRKKFSVIFPEVAAKADPEWKRKMADCEFGERTLSLMIRDLKLLQKKDPIL